MRRVLEESWLAFQGRRCRRDGLPIETRTMELSLQVRCVVNRLATRLRGF